MSLNHRDSWAQAGWCENSRRSIQGVFGWDVPNENRFGSPSLALSQPFLETVAGKPVQGIRGPRSLLKDPTLGPRAWRRWRFGRSLVSDRRRGHQWSECQDIWDCHQSDGGTSRGPASNWGYTACFSRMAMERVRPGTEAMSSTDASLIPCKEPKRRNSVRFRLGPMPVTKSMGDRRLPLLRRLR